METMNCQWEIYTKKDEDFPSAGMVLAAVFWDSQEIILMDYLEKVKTITDENYLLIMNCLRIELIEKRPRLARKKILFHRHSVPAQTSAATAAKLLGVEVLNHSTSVLFSLLLLFVRRCKKVAGGKKISLKRGSNNRKE